MLEESDIRRVTDTDIEQITVEDPQRAVRYGAAELSLGDTLLPDTGDSFRVATV